MIHSMPVVIRRQILAALVSLFLCPTLGQAQKPGERISVTFGGRSQGESSVTLGFRFCPAGHLAEVDPDNPTRYRDTSVPIPGFWMAETELSQAAFESIRALASVDSDTKNLEIPSIEDLISRGGKWIAASTKVSKGAGSGHSNAPPVGSYRLAPLKAPDKPLLAITLADAVRICLVLQSIRNDSTTSPPSAGPKFVQQELRLPSYQEWQYACRAIASTNDSALQSPGVNARRHFYCWPANPRDAYESLKRQCDKLGDMFKDPDADHADPEAELAFDGSQDAVMEILATAQNDASEKHKYKPALYLLNKFLTQECQSCPTFAFDFSNTSFNALPDRERYLPDVLHAATAVTAKSANSWGINYMLGNIAEWTIDTTQSKSGVSEIWGQLSQASSSSDSASNSSLASSSYRLAGGSFLYKDHKAFTIWGAFERTYADAIKPARAEFDVAGLRPVLITRLSNAWRLLVRSHAFEILDERADPAKIIASLNKDRQDIEQNASQVPGGHPLDDVDYYKAFAQFGQNANKVALRDSLNRYSKTLKDENASTSVFLSKLSNIVQEQ